MDDSHHDEATGEFGEEHFEQQGLESPVGEPLDERWDQELDLPDDDAFRQQLDLTPEERAILDNYGGQDRGLRGLDAALNEAAQMVAVSNQRIGDLRKMHALMLLKRVKSALDNAVNSDSDDDGQSRSEYRQDMVGIDHPEFSDSDDDSLLEKDMAAGYRPRKQRVPRGPDSDEFAPVIKGGSDYGGRHSRAGSLGGGKDSVYTEDDEEEGLLSKDAHDPDAEYTAQPFYIDGHSVAPGFDSDLEKGDGESGSTGSGEPGEKPEVSMGPERFEKRYKKTTRLNWPGATVLTIWVLSFFFYMYIRITKTLGLGSYVVYGVFVLLVEVLGASTTFLYGINLIWLPVNKIYLTDYGHPGADKVVDDTASTKDGLDDASVPGGSVRGSSVRGSVAAGDLEEGGVKGDGYDPPPCGVYHIRVLIPCYKEETHIVMATLDAIRAAALPPGCTRTIYVCDDSKDKHKRRQTQRRGRDCVYISGRKRPKGESNGKSGNLNNACEQIYPPGCTIPGNEVICIMDADQVANPLFFLKMLPFLDGGDDVGMVLSPQCFHNINQQGDIFNHQNIHFWEYMQPGYDALGFISCTGTNFLVRAQAFQECGWSPHYTLTEDYALGMELKKRHWQCRYMPEYLAIGEAPDQVRNAFQQRSRWCKGHFQVMFSKEHCPLLQRKLSIFQKLMFCTGVWSYVVASIATPTFILVPLLTIWFGIFPIVLSMWAAVGLSVYYVATSMVLQYTKSRKHIFPLFFANISTVIMFWTYIKALFRSILAKTRFGDIKFKTTLKGLGKLQDSAVGDLWLPTTVFIASAVTLGIGIGKAANASNSKTTLLVSLLWMIFNMIPPYLLLHYTFVGKGSTLKIVSRILLVLSTLCGIGALVLIWLLYPKPFNYNTAVNDSFTFFKSQMVGNVPANVYGVDWRATAYAQDSKSPIVARLNATLGAAHDSSGGWMTGGAGGNLKMTQPTAFTTAMLAWGLLSFPSGLNKAGARTDTLQQIQVGVEFLKKTLLEYKANDPQFSVIYQVGNLSTESRYWGYPEAFTGTRPSYSIPTQTGTSDLTSSLCAAFAASSLAFQSTDRAYAQGLLNLAANMYTAAKTYPGSYSAEIRANVCATQFERSKIGPTGAVLASAGACKGPYDAFNGSALAWYNSTSYYDDMTWAASWMFQATGQATYLNDAINFYVHHAQGPEQVYDEQLLFNWNNVFWGANLKLAQLKGDPAYHRQMQYFLKYWLCGTGGVPVQFTPLGRSWNSNDGSLGTTANAVFLATLYGQLINSKEIAKSKRYVCWARAQTRYMLGDSGPSFVVGYGSKYPRYAQSMGASCPGFPFQGRAQNCTAAQLTSKKGNPHTLTGALIEQSSFSDSLSTVRATNNSRIAPEYNAGFVGALAGVQQAPGTWAECLQGNGILLKDNTVCGATV